MVDSVFSVVSVVSVVSLIPFPPLNKKRASTKVETLISCYAPSN